MAPQMFFHDDEGPMTNTVIWLGAGIALTLVLLRLDTRIKIRPEDWS